VNDRVVLVAAAVLVAVLISLGALAALRDYARPVFVNGADTAKRIDNEVGDLVAARFPDADVGTARCPPVLDLTGDRSGQCTLPVAGGELGIVVAKNPYPGFPPALNTTDALFVKSDAERDVGADLAKRYGEEFSVRCPGPAAQVVARKTAVICSVEAPDLLRRGIEVRVSGYSDFYVLAPLSGIATRAERVFGRDVASRTEGGVDVAGSAMEEYVRRSAAAEAHGEVGRRRLVRYARCPVRIVLREGGRTTCTVGIGGLPFRYDVHFEKGFGLYAASEKNVVVIAVLREIAARYFERPAFTGGMPLAAHVDCGKAAVAFVEPGTSVPCTASVGDRRYSFSFEIDDANGAFSIVED